MDQVALALAKSVKACALCARLHRTSGGSSDTELNELTVNPVGAPSAARVVTTVTPVANWASAF